MRRFSVPLALLIATALMVITTASAAAHNAGCVRTGNGEWVFVGSNNSSPAVPEQNPRSSDDPPDRVGNYLDLTPDTRGDQYGVRFVAEIGNGAVQHPDNCEARETP